ncbi:MAG: 3-keto-5-aminohexanoate cleavage protein [Micrococcales bacterium]
MTFLQLALNGDREHPKVPRLPYNVAADVDRVVRAGAQSVHVHPFDDASRESLNASDCARVLLAIRTRHRDVPISLTTSATIEPDAQTRLALVKQWVELPDLVTANQGEDGIVELSEYLMSRGVGIEAGLLTADDAQKFVQWSGRHRCVRVLVEPLNTDPDVAVRHAAAIEKIVNDAGVSLPQVHHGYGIASWSVNERALQLGHGIRTGLEDVAVLPDGSIAEDNLALTLTAVAMIEAVGR